MLFKSKKVFVINSRNRTSGTDSNFVAYLEIPSEDYTHVAVLYSIIPKSFYLVDSTTSFTLTEISSSVTITIPEGNYNRVTFQSAIQTLLNTNSPHSYTYSLSFPNASTTVNDGKFTITVSGNGGVQPSLSFTNSNNAFELLGFNYGVTNTFTANTLKSTNVIKLLTNDVILIRSDIANNDGDNILQEVYSVGNDAYSNIVFEQNNIEYNARKLANHKVNAYHFWLTNELEEIELNGLNWFVTIVIFSIDDTTEMLKDYIRLKTLKN